MKIRKCVLPLFLGLWITHRGSPREIPHGKPDEEIWQAKTVGEISQFKHTFLVRPKFLTGNDQYFWALDTREWRIWQGNRDFHIERTFSKAGEGPAEIQPNAYSFYWDRDKLTLIHNFGGKISYFSSSGEYIRSKRPGVNKRILFELDNHGFYQGDKQGEIEWVKPNGESDSIHLVEKDTYPIQMYFSWLEEFVFLCTGSSPENRFQIALVDLKEDEVVFKGEYDMRMRIQKSDYPDLPSGMVFTPRTIHGCTSHSSLGFILVERTIETEENWSHPELGRFQILHIFNPWDKKIRNIRLYLGENDFLNNLLFFNGRWVGFEGSSGKLKILQIEPENPFAIHSN